MKFTADFRADKLNKHLFNEPKIILSTYNKLKQHTSMVKLSLREDPRSPLHVHTSSELDKLISEVLTSIQLCSCIYAYSRFLPTIGVPRQNPKQLPTDMYIGIWKTLKNWVAQSKFKMSTSMNPCKLATTTIRENFAFQFLQCLDVQLSQTIGLALGMDKVKFILTNATAGHPLATPLLLVRDKTAKK